MRIFLPTYVIGAALAALAVPAAAQNPEADIAAGFRDWMKAQNVPGLCWGVVKDGALLMQQCEGVQDLETKTPASADTLFRIASMSKAFTGYAILDLKAQGKLGLEDTASKHVPQMSAWAGGISLGNLLHHTAGFVTDDPWGDRQQPMPEAEFTAILKEGVPLQRAPNVAYEYSNFGYATLGRIISNASNVPYQRYVAERIFQPLGMTSTGYDVAAVPQARLARPYRYENGQWSPEPTMADGTFGAMGGVITSTHDYAKWVAHLLSAWPVAASAKMPPQQQLLLEMHNGGGFTHIRRRPGKDAPECTLHMTYAAGLVTGRDCQLGRIAFHSGGYPGYGSHMLLLPDTGLGIFAFANRTYAAPLPPVWDAAGLLQRAGLATERALPVSPQLVAGYTIARHIWADGHVRGKEPQLAMNFLLDRSASNWAKELARLKKQVGSCETTPPIEASGNLSGHFHWTCQRGQLAGELLLAPTADVQIQALRLSRL